MKRKTSTRVFDIINSVFLLLIAIICVYPFLNVLFTALSDGNYLTRGDVNFLPKGTNWEAFKHIMNTPRFNVAQGLKNSFIYTFFGTIVAVFSTYITAYVLSRPRFKHRYWIMSIFIITWVFDAGIIPQYIIYNKFGFIDNPLVMIVPGAINTQFLIIAKNYFDGLPKELEEAAFVDGANDWKILTRIYLPISPTILAVLTVFNAVNIWNQYLIPQIYLKNENLQTVQQMIKNVVIGTGFSGTTFSNTIINGVTLNQQNLKAAATFVAMLPILIVYPIVQRHFKKGILIGSVKG